MILFALAAALPLADGPEGPDPTPGVAAVKACDRKVMSAIAVAEPERRLRFSASAYAEQQAIARERAAATSGTPAGTQPSQSGAATTELALTQLSGRQRRLDDAIAVEMRWRDLLTEMRADYLANCTNGKRRDAE